MITAAQIFKGMIARMQESKANWQHEMEQLSRSDREQRGSPDFSLLDVQVEDWYVIWNRDWTGRMCPRYGYSGGQDKTTYFSSWFLAKVARPPRWKDYFETEERGRVGVAAPVVVGDA